MRANIEPVPSNSMTCDIQQCDPLDDRVHGFGSYRQHEAHTLHDVQLASPHNGLILLQLRCDSHTEVGFADIDQMIAVRRPGLEPLPQGLTTDGSVQTRMRHDALIEQTVVKAGSDGSTCLALLHLCDQ